MRDMSLMQNLRMEEKVELPRILQDLSALQIKELNDLKDVGEIKNFFPHIADRKVITFISKEKKEHQKQRVGVIFSGGQAAGGHNVIIGLFDALKKLHPGSELYGFLSGPDGLIKNKSIPLDEKILSNYLNQGGFDLLGSGRTKIETTEQFQAVAKTVKELKLDGLVIIGGDDSNTNAAFLAEYFLKEKIHTTVVGVPKTIDGDLKNSYIEISFGFDTASKTYANIIGNIARDALSSKKYYHFVKLMGRSASHITLECALQVHPNMAIINEEVEREKKTISDIVNDICCLITARALEGKDYGIILIPEGVLEFIPELKLLLSEINKILKSDGLNTFEMDAMQKEHQKLLFIQSLLTDGARNCFLSLPKDLQIQLLQLRDPHGNIEVSKIDTERFFMDLVKRELMKHKRNGTYHGKFSALSFFCGYEGRSCFPSPFDSKYTYALGHVAALLINEKLTGYMALVQKLVKNVSDWQIGAVPLINLMHMEKRQGELKPVVKKTMVDLDSPLFKLFKEQKSKWMIKDDYQYPGPIQFYGPPELIDRVTVTLQTESSQTH